MARLPQPTSGPRAAMVGSLDPTAGQGLKVAAQQLSNFADSQLRAITRAEVAAARVQERTDLIHRTRALNSFDAFAVQTGLGYRDGGDMSNPSSAVEFNDSLKAQIVDIVGNHEGGEASQMKLLADLENHRGKAHLRFSSEVNKAGRQIINDGLDSRAAVLAAAAAESGDVEGAFLEWHADVVEAAPALSESEERARRDSGRATIVKSVFDTHKNDGDLESAREILATPDLAKFMEPAELRKMKASVTVMEKAAVKGVAEGNQAVEKATTILGRELTAEERLRLANVAPPAGRKTLQDEVNEFTQVFDRAPTEAELQKMAGVWRASVAGRQTLNEKVVEWETETGQTATREIIDKLAGTTVVRTPTQEIAATEAALGRAMTPVERETMLLKKGSFGASLEGLAKEFTANNAPGFASGTLTPLEDRQFLNHVTTLLRPITIRNPVTKEEQVVMPKLTPSTSEALRRRGVDPMSLIAQLPGSGPDQTGDEDQDTAFNDGKGMWAHADALTGIGSAAISGFSNFPVAGGVTRALVGTREVSEINRARSRFTKQLGALVTSLQANPKFAEGERQQIRNDLNMELTMFSTEDGMRDALEGMDEALATTQLTLQKILSTPGLTIEEKRMSIQQLNRITQFRTFVLQVPPTMTPDEARALPPGTWFRTTDGRRLQR